MNLTMYRCSHCGEVRTFDPDVTDGASFDPTRHECPSCSGGPIEFIGHTSVPWTRRDMTTPPPVEIGGSSVEREQRTR